MTAEIKPRIDFEGRTRLETVIPLSTPYLVFLDPSGLCNAKCSWCPTGSGEARKYRKPQLMDWDLYRKIIDDLAGMPEPVKTLRLYADGEPLLNPRFCDMVKYAKGTGRFGQIDTTTNGLLFDTKQIQSLSLCGMDKIFISVPQNYTKEYVSNVAYLRLNSSMLIYCKMIGDGLLKAQKQRFLDDFEEFCDRIFIENLSPCWPGYDVEGVNSSRGIYQQPLPEKEPMICPYLFYSIKINSDGTASKCFLDWKHQYLVGDLCSGSFKDVWNGRSMTWYRKEHLRGDRKLLMSCRECGQLRYGAPDNIDPYAEEILRRMS
jgi:MoaA/NifB/PqqE/SkfB family radical SAM enzyme